MEGGPRDMVAKLFPWRSVRLFALSNLFKLWKCPEENYGKSVTVGFRIKPGNHFDFDRITYRCTGDGSTVTVEMDRFKTGLKFSISIFNPPPARELALRVGWPEV